MVPQSYDILKIALDFCQIFHQNQFQKVLLKIEVDVFMNSANVEQHAFLTLAAPPSRWFQKFTYMLLHFKLESVSW
jgi:hypothetical protein